MIKLIGILIIIIGFLLKLDTIAVVLTAGVITGIVGGLGFGEILETLGEAFITNRYMTIFFVTLPIIGLLEKYGLKERAASLISNLKAATTGKILSFYMVLRTIAAALSLRIGGHVEFIRPLIYPMAEGAAKNKYGELSEEETEDIKGLSASVENYANFYGQNVFIAAGGVLLIVGTLNELGVEVSEKDVSKAAIPIAIIGIILAVIQFRIFDRKLEKSKNKN
ncbi:DUF969 domain-containing protein [Anaerosalibacter bizertensis]|uniref:DUF969 domain-containing protein n=1 Tax=Anaerosalibacter bizertensis TaxID=932217 RepID=A0A844FIQ7_9FIRM|nr:DUF969 domain-containing protein [Anaerosalibacter bizertensis]MBV1820696.1 DUF969 domain-containing protein [Bacteroidales bacterium MSK.15.36]HHV26983.1 DUF969 family protein [Tissierellia bacterium]MBU5294388.1 DUF969 domain-containing protein [Anaerosalibacter bizertensis]MCB5559128.1 DUF969 domain-containing protein [Anaerosalibacter bizertensis]MCG4581973.1 DUF969 domain-containing protein [Anaerosalibacter bizertensis]